MESPNERFTKIQTKSLWQDYQVFTIPNLVTPEGGTVARP